MTRFLLVEKRGYDDGPLKIIIDSTCLSKFKAMVEACIPPDRLEDDYWILVTTKIDKKVAGL